MLCRDRKAREDSQVPRGLKVTWESVARLESKGSRGSRERAATFRTRRMSSLTRSSEASSTSLSLPVLVRSSERRAQKAHKANPVRRALRRQSLSPRRSRRLSYPLVRCRLPGALLMSQLSPVQGGHR